MMSKAGRCVFLWVMLLSAASMAQPQVSVTITGGFDEIIALLVQLRDSGYGQAHVVDEDPMKLEVHSITVGSLDELEPTPPQEVPVEEPLPALGLHDLTLPEVSSGQSTLASVRVSDPDHVVDTVAIEVALPGGLTKDLYDNSAHGDTVAADGVWMRTVAIPPGTPPGVYAVKVTVYNVNGEPVTTRNEAGEDLPLSVAGELTVTE